MNLTAYIDRANRWFFRLTDDDGVVVADNASPIDDKTAFEVGIALPVPTPTLADVLAEGNDPGGTAIEGDGSADVVIGAGPVPPSPDPDFDFPNSGRIFIRRASGSDGGAIDINGGQSQDAGTGGGIGINAGTGGPTAGGTAAALYLEPGGPATNGLLEVFTDGSYGAAGEVLQSAGTDTFQTKWGRIPSSAELVITEDASGAAGTYTGSIVVPGGATITGLYWSKVRDFNQAATLIIGDADDPDGFVTGGDVNSYPDGKTANVFASAYPFDVSDAGEYVTVTASMTKALFSATDHDILIVVTVADPTDPPPVDLGELRVLVTWALPPSSAATFEAAA